jgi:hypothetical protein
VAKLQGLKDRIKAARDSGDPAAEEAIAAEGFALLRRLEARAGVPRAEPSAELETLLSGLARAVARLSTRREITAQAVSSAVMSLLVSLGAHKH